MKFPIRSLICCLTCKGKDNKRMKKIAKYHRWSTEEGNWKARSTG